MVLAGSGKEVGKSGHGHEGQGDGCSLKIEKFIPGLRRRGARVGGVRDNTGTRRGSRRCRRGATSGSYRRYRTLLVFREMGMEFLDLNMSRAGLSPGLED